MTEKAYVHWTKRFIFFHNKRHLAEMGEAEIACFLSSLANEGHVSAFTQNQAFNALLSLYKEVLSKKIGLIEGVVVLYTELDNPGYGAKGSMFERTINER